VNVEFLGSSQSWPPWLFVFAVAAVAQLAKFVIYSLLRRRPDVRALVSSNGLPSLHAVVLGCLTALIWQLRGAEDPAYNAVLIYSGIILHDSMKVKGRVEQGHRMALLLADDFQRRFTVVFGWRELLLPLSSRRSHRPAHVVAGLLLGILLARLGH